MIASRLLMPKQTQRRESVCARALWPHRADLRLLCLGHILFIYFGSIHSSFFRPLLLCQLCVSRGEALSILSNYPLSGFKPTPGGAEGRGGGERKKKKTVFFGQNRAFGLQPLSTRGTIWLARAVFTDRSTAAAFSCVLRQ